MKKENRELFAYFQSGLLARVKWNDRMICKKYTKYYNLAECHLNISQAKPSQSPFLHSCLHFMSSSSCFMTINRTTNGSLSWSVSYSFANHNHNHNHNHNGRHKLYVWRRHRKQISSINKTKSWKWVVLYVLYQDRMKNNTSFITIMIFYRYE